MNYTVHWKKLPGKAIIRTEEYEDRDTAISEAEFTQIVGPSSVEVTVTDSTGKKHYKGVFG